MEERKLPFGEHLDELRRRLLYCIFAFIICSIIAWQFTPIIIKLIAVPVKKFVYISVTEVLFTYLKVTVWSGFFFSLPVTIYNIWKYIQSALLPHEKKYVLIFSPFSFILFFAGASFAFFIAVPLAVKFLIGFGSRLAEPMLSIKEYVSFFGWLTFIFGVTFEFPLVTLLLVKLKITTPDLLRHYRRHAIIAIFIAAAILTPTHDIFTLLLLVGPLLILYEISIWLSYLVNRPSNNLQLISR